MEVRVKIDVAEPQLVEIIRYTWQLFARHIGFKTIIVSDNANILIGTDPSADVFISRRFAENIALKKYDFRHWFESKPLLFENNTPDYLATCFYLVNCLQEYDSTFKDEYGRFPFQKSLQCHFNCVEENLVAKYFNRLFDSIPFLKTNVTGKRRASKIFISHDIDHINGAWKEEGKWALKRGRFDIIFKLLLNHLMRKPDWLNMDKIMKIETEYDVKSTFFWLANQGEYAGIKNADYNINDKRILQSIKRIERAGFENGLHKSSFTEPYAEEIEKLPFPTFANRNHYLKIRLPGSFSAIEESGLMLDSSLGFAEKTGFRNSFGMPFCPFDMENGRAFDFVETPLHIMDATLLFYSNFSLAEAKNSCIDFLEKNREDAVISILWHNSYFSEYKFKDALALFKTILAYCQQGHLESVSSTQIVNEFGKMG